MQNKCESMWTIDRLIARPVARAMFQEESFDKL